MLPVGAVAPCVVPNWMTKLAAGDLCGKELAVSLACYALWCLLCIRVQRHGSMCLFDFAKQLSGSLGWECVLLGRVGFWGYVWLLAKC